MQTNNTAVVDSVNDLDEGYLSEEELVSAKSFIGCPAGTINAEYDDKGHLLNYEDANGVWTTEYAKELELRQLHVASDGCVSQRPRTVTNWHAPTRAENAASLNADSDYSYRWSNDNWDYNAIK